MRVPQRFLLVPAVSAAVALAAGAPSTALAAEENSTVRRVLVVMVEFSDSSFEDPAATRAVLEDGYFSESESLTSYYDEVSRGALTIAPSAAADGGVLGPITLDMSAVGCDTGTMKGLTLAELERQGLRYDVDFEHVSMVYPNALAGCGFGGLGALGGGHTFIPMNGPSVDQTTLVHEVGHNLGYDHQFRTRCSDTDLASCQDTETTSHKTPMGGGGVEAGLSAPELIIRGWLSEEEVVEVTESGTYTLAPLYGGDGGIRSLDIPVGDDRLVLELRGASGTLDRNIEGVHAYRAEGGNYYYSALVDLAEGADSWAGGGEPDLDALPAGTTLTDTAHEVEIEIVQSGGGAATVAVSLDGVPAPEQADSGDVPAEDAAADSGEDSTADAGSEAQTQGSAQPPSGSEDEDSGDLAATGTESTAWMPLGAGGAALLALGGVFLLRSRRKQAAASGRHAR